jgi:hypothetical protein
VLKKEEKRLERLGCGLTVASCGIDLAVERGSRQLLCQDQIQKKKMHPTVDVSFLFDSYQLLFFTIYQYYPCRTNFSLMIIARLSNISFISFLPMQ